MRTRTVLGAALAAALATSVSAGERQIAPRLTMGETRSVPAGDSGYSRGPAVAFGGGRYLLVYQDGYNGLGGDSNILGLLLDAKGEPVGKPIAICSAKGAQDSPAAAACGDKFLVAWADFRSEKDYDVYAAVVDASGKVGAEFPVAGGEKQPGGQAGPAVTSDGKETFLVLWQSHSADRGVEIRCARISAEGKPLDAEGGRRVGDGSGPRATFTGGKYYVTAGLTSWVLDPDGTAGKPVAMWAPVAATGHSLTAAYGKALEILNLSPGPDPWGWGGNGTIVGLTINANGTSPETGAAEHRWGGAAAAQADRVTKNVIEAARWKNHDAWPQGMPGGFKGSHDGSWPSGRTAAAFNGRSLLVVWTTAYFIDILRIANRDLYLKRVVDGWPAVDDLPLKLVSGPTDEVNPALASDVSGGAVLAWERQNPAGGVLVEYALLREEADTQPPRIAYIQKLSEDKMIIGFDEPIGAASVKPDAVAIEGAAVKSATYNAEGPAQGREIIVETEPLTVGKPYPIKITGIADSSGNAAKGEPFAYLARPGTAQRTFFIDRWLTIGAWPTNYGADYVGVATCRPSPGDIVKARAEKDLIEDMKRVVPPEKYEELTKTPLETAVPRDFGGEKTWKVSACRWLHSLMDFIDSGYGKKSFALAYAHNYIWSDKEREAVLRIDSQNGHRAWLNGQVVSDDPQIPKLASRGLHDYTNEVAVKLKPGWNQLMVAVDSNIFRWRFVAQLVDRQGRPIRDLTWQLDKPQE